MSKQVLTTQRTQEQDPRIEDIYIPSEEDDTITILEDTDTPAITDQYVISEE